MTRWFPSCTSANQITMSQSPLRKRYSPSDCSRDTTASPYLMGRPQGGRRRLHTPGHFHAPVQPSQGWGCLPRLWQGRASGPQTGSLQTTERQAGKEPKNEQLFYSFSHPFEQTTPAFHHSTPAGNLHPRLPLSDTIRPDQLEQRAIRSGRSFHFSINSLIFPTTADRLLITLSFPNLTMLRQAQHRLLNPARIA